ncbi:electron transfer flavoprotein subunit alpha/FixB family protein [Cellulomonas sp. 73-92]|mgnify:CR=1 FL=1|uniref:electron transfer flavoprotein subunit alpha/FixB family protein n=1 Tax=Cellulomonas sp. 73-92 TaxID=1895740 RepID=UPI000ADBD3D7|nr:electron transfer flavoprotein subunit alpha/FixB family protein [Cellulomonas sp. 73-92]
MSLGNAWVVLPNPAAAAGLARGARGLADEVNAVVVGADAALPGADLTVAVPAPPVGALAEGYAASIAELLQARGAQIVLLGADVSSRLLAGLVAARLGTSALTVQGVAVEGDGLVVSRTAYAGLATTTERPAGSPAVLVVAPGVLPAQEEAGAGRVEHVDMAPAPEPLRVVEVRPKAGEPVNLAAATRVVGVGRGFADEADLRLARELAAALGAELACSRPLAEGLGWLPTERYVGVSGATIRPDLYLAVGVSGQVQHMVGVNQAKVIVAINKDKNAPVFGQADLGVVGDLYDVLPALTNALAR